MSVIIDSVLPLADSACDITIDPNNTDQYIVWAIGGLGETAFKHFNRANSKRLS